MYFFCYAGYPLRLTHRSGVLDRSHWFCEFTYSFPSSPILPPLPFDNRTSVLYKYEDMAIEPVSSSAEEKPTREQLTVDPVAAAVTSRPANGAIDSSQQSEPELGEPQSTSQALSHAEKLLGLAAKLGGVGRSL